MWVFSHLRPYFGEEDPEAVHAPTNASVDNRQVEYGVGCLNMAFPGSLTQSFGVPRRNPINGSDPYELIRRTEQKLVECAICLEKHRCASFAGCFRSN